MMTERLSVTAIGVAGCILAAPAALAADPAPAQNQNIHPAADPNQKICEDVTTVGSRLAKKRICATRAEWAEMRKRDRETTEEIQRLQGRPCVETALGKGTGVAPAC